MPSPKRICIYPKDIQQITGRSARYARKYHQHLRIILEKEDHQFVTIQEFCDFADLPVDEVEQLILS